MQTQIIETNASIPIINYMTIQLKQLSLTYHLSTPGKSEEKKHQKNVVMGQNDLINENH